ncbi:hypothetical protein K438DRAFT_1973808 [Mycena galopus ATCC 62051]|nr:hypothetical protein K438DRAFT_1973808 [Mycena galopus ATCC 62051]
MSASSKKDRVFTLGVVDALVDDILTLPVAQKNFLKFTMMVLNDALNEDVAMLSVGLPPLSIFLFAQCANEENFTEILRDEEFSKTLDTGKEFTLQDSSWSFSADASI